MIIENWQHLLRKLRSAAPLKVAILVTTLVLSGCPFNDFEPGSGASVGNASFDNIPGTPIGSSGLAISGKPEAATLVDEGYNFQPDIQNHNSANIQFSVRNAPHWTNFDAQYGTLWGVPMSTDIGVYENIVISATTDTGSVSLPAFSIEVLVTGPASVKLNWVPPADNIDGSEATDLAGYNLYYGKTSGSYSSFIEIPNAGVTSVEIDGLLPTTYYFAATSFNTSNIESRLSGELAIVAN